jgi:hypothetical protein
MWRYGHTTVRCGAAQRTDAEGLIVHRGQTAYVLLNLFPYNSGHMLVCPYRHIPTYDQATAEEVAEMCWCRCSSTPAPATAPWFIPMLNPSQRET